MLCPQVFCVEVVGEEGGEYESFPWQSHESSPSDGPDRSLQHSQEMQTRPTIGESFSCNTIGGKGEIAPEKKSRIFVKRMIQRMRMVREGMEKEERKNELEE